MLRLVEPVARADKVVGGWQIVGRVRDNRAPTVEPRTCLQGPHQAQLKPVAAMFPQYPYPAKIAGIADVGRRDNPGKSHSFGSVKREPPMTVIIRRDGSGIEECQAMKFGECIRDVIVLSINLTNPVHWRNSTDLTCCCLSPLR